MASVISGYYVDGTQTVDVDCLKEVKLEIQEKLISKEEAMQTDITPMFYRGMKQKLIKGENISILLKAQTTKGKSTLGLAILDIGNAMIKDLPELYEKSSLKDDNDDYFKYISQDQVSFLRLARNPNLKNVFSMIDEWSSIANSGINSMIESKYMDYYDAVCSQRFLHRIFCTPTSEYDKSALLILNIIDVDKANFITKCELYYNDPTERQPVPLGTVTFCLKPILGDEQ
jgi:hypothetical protein